MKKVISVLLIVATMVAFSGCTEAAKRNAVDIKSNFGGGLERTIRVYTADGELMAEYKGKIDIASEDGYVKFDHDGKRYIYYNCFVETIAEI